jgi:hypothetical protein
VGRDILVTFPSSKNDQFHQGSTTLLRVLPSEDIAAVFQTPRFSVQKEVADKSTPTLPGEEGRWLETG